jgi:ubiquinone biosynthesis protein COQ4
VNSNYRHLNNLQKIIMSTGSGLVCLFDPSRDDMISTFGETTALNTLKQIHQKMLNDQEGSQILLEKPIINSKTVNLSYLDKLPDNTFGKAYMNLLKEYDITPDSRKPVQFIEDNELAYVMRRYREIHDLTHCVLGMSTKLIGEVTVKWFEAIQLGLPMCWLAGMFGSLRLGPKHGEHYLNYYLPWVLNTAPKSKLLINVYFEKYFEMPLDELREKLNIDPPPPSPSELKKMNSKPADI